MTGDGPTVSVVVPTRDRPDQLGRAVATAVDQTRPALEVLVVDDGSDPLVPEPPGARVLRTERPGGPGAARNRGAVEAGGELLAFLDDDDRWRPELLERLVEVMVDEAADAVVCGWQRRDGEVVLETISPPTTDELPARLLEDPVVVPSCLVVRASAFTALGGFDPTLRYGEDWELALRLVEGHRVVTVPDVLVEREVHPNARYGRRLVGDHREMVRRLRPRLTGLPPAERRRARHRHRVRLAQYALRVALEPVLVGRGPWRARHARRVRRAASR